MDYKTAYAKYGRVSGLSQDYFDGSNVKEGYSTVASQQNPDPVYTYRHKISKKGGGFEYGDPVNVYKADTPVAAPASAPAPAPTPAPPPKTKPKSKPKPVEHSPEIEQAKERVKSYESDIMSGKTSDDIYSYDNDYSKDTYIAKSSGANTDYSFDASQGSAGIGTPTGGDSSQQARRAASSFLDLKKSELKSKYNLQDQS